MYTFSFSGAGEATKCTQEPAALLKSGATLAYVKVVAPDGVTPTFNLDGTDIAPTQMPGNLYEIKLNSPGADNNVLVVTPNAGGAKGVACDGVPLQKSAPKVEQSVDALDLAAFEAFQNHELQAQLDKLKATKGMPPGTKFLVHLPSGQPAYPFAATYTEGETVQIVTIAPTRSPRTLELDVSDCGAVNTFRTDINTSDDDKKESADLKNRFVLMPVGQYFSCGSGAASYTLKTHPANGGQADVVATTKISFRPKYHVAAIAVLGWDNAHRTTYSAETQSGSTMATVVAHHDKIGRAGYLGGVWMIGGVDYEHMRPWNYVGNLWIGADPESPLSDFAVGVALTPTGGASVVIGASFHQNEALEGLKAGDAFMGDGDVPTHHTWGGVNPGFLFGISLDSRVYDAIIKRFE